MNRRGRSVGAFEPGENILDTGSAGAEAETTHAGGSSGIINLSSAQLPKLPPCSLGPVSVS